MENNRELGPALTWNQLADIYNKSTSGLSAQAQEMDAIFEWAEKQTNKFVVTEDGCIHRIIKRRAKHE